MGKPSTESAAATLRQEGVAADAVFVTGNTGNDAVLYVKERLERGELRGADWPMLDPARMEDVLRRGDDVATVVGSWRTLDERRRKLQGDLDTLRQQRNSANTSSLCRAQQHPQTGIIFFPFRPQAIRPHASRYRMRPTCFLHQIESNRFRMAVNAR